MPNQKTWLLIILGLIVIGALYYAISPLFRNVAVEDELPDNIIEDSVERELMEANSDEKAISATRFPIMGTTGHPAEGTVRVLDTADGQVLRYEDFKTINGPNLHVYLAKGLNADEYIDLGPIKGTEGNINYEVPADVDLAEYRYVMYWCVPFAVLFNYAEIES